jgi:hypothetical protein
MNNNLTINLASYRILSDGIDIYFTADSTIGQKIPRRWCPIIIKNDVPIDNEENTYWSFDGSPKAVKVNFDFFKHGDDEINHHYFLKRVFTQLLQRQFNRQEFIVGTSYIGDARVLVPTDTEQPNRLYEVFDKYSLRVDFNVFKESSGVFLSYDGQSTVSKITYKESELTDSSLVGKVILDRCIYSRNRDNFPNQIDDCRFIYNRSIENVLGKIEKRRPTNKYREYHKKIFDFYSNHLSGQSIGGSFEILSGGFLKIPNSFISSVDSESNLLEFKNHVRNVNVYDGLKRAGGPYATPDLSNLQFLFIFMDRDKEFANKLFTFMNKGFKNFPGLEKYVSVPFVVDFHKSLRLQDEQKIVDEVHHWIDTTYFDPAKKYFVLYVSPIDKNEEDEYRNSVYFRIKELLLHKNISSQVVFKDNLYKDAFNFYLPNIAIAILAKLGGIPWRLPYPLQKDLVIGLGAYQTADTSDALIGNAICFRNDGQFQEFRVFPGSDISKLGENLKRSVQDFIKTFGECNRVIIHYYKILGKKERNALDIALKQLNLDIPYIFVTVNETESKDYVMFDEDFEGKMPMSGTIVKLRYNEFLLCNNTRYASSTGQKLLGYPFPIKVRIASQPKELTKDFALVMDIINQVYEFSRIYWKSIKQRNKPVTIEYSEIIAKVVSQFTSQTLPESEIATKSLWFL